MLNFVTMSSLLSVFCANFGHIGAEDALPIPVEIFTTDFTLVCSVEHDNIKLVSMIGIGSDKSMVIKKVQWVHELRDGSEQTVSKGTKPIAPYLGRVEVNKPRMNDWNLKFNNFTKDLEGSYWCNSYIDTDVKELKRYNISVVSERNDDVTDRPATLVIDKKHGEDAEISCSTTQPGTVVWSKTDEDGDRSKDVLISKGLTTYTNTVSVTNKGNTWTLTLRSVNSGSNGIYVCKIAESEIAIYQIVVEDIETRKEIVEFHKTKDLICVLPHHITQTEFRHISWTFRGINIHRINPENTVGTSILTLTKVTPNDSDGIYECKYKNKLINKCIFELEVHRSPFVDDSQSTPAEVTFIENKLANLTCNILGQPEPNITWFRKQKIKNAKEERIGVHGKILLIPSISRYAADKYICEGKNTHDSIRHEINVRVSFEPEIEVMKQEVTICREIDVNLTCLVQSSNQLELSNVQWYARGCAKGCSSIVDNYKYQLRIDKMEGYPAYVVTLTLLITNGNKEIDYSGTYNCQVFNQGNEVTSKDIVVKDTRNTDESNSDVEVGPYC